MMTSVAINRDWYNEIKELVKTVDAYFYNRSWDGREMVEVDVEEEEFNRVSKELGWIE